jgi:hypothetical protein
MKTPRSGIRVLAEGSAAARGFKSAISLHCHTNKSKEVLDFVPYYASKIPVVADFFVRELEKHKQKRGEVIDFARAYWTPPISPREVLEAECGQIERELNLEPIVSITDHDEIQACTQLQVLQPGKDIPVSLEWTVPFAPGFFHLGVHNLPRDKPAEVWGLLKAYTRDPASASLVELLALLSGYDEVLVVFNHPLWDIERIGEARHRLLVEEFLSSCGQWIHAIEINGYRSWSENQAAMKLAADHAFPLVSGGDRHGHEPNAMLNLTAASSFAEFASEVRLDRVSEVAILPSYDEPLVMRMLEAVGDVLRYYPNYVDGQRFWTDRIFWTLEDATVRPLSFYWGSRGPAWVRASLWVMRIIGSRRFRPAMRRLLPGQEGVRP